MKKFMQWLNEKLTPIANFCGTQRHLSAMQKGFMTMVGFILVSAIFMIIANPPVSADMIAKGGFWSIFSGWYDFATTYKLAILIPFNMTMGMLSVIASFAIAYHLADSYKMSSMNSGLTSIVLFMMTAAPANYYTLADGNVLSGISMTYLGAQGLFTAIIVSLVSVEVTRLCKKYRLTIRLPESVPPFLSETFSSVIPMLLNILIFFGGNLLIQNFDPTLSIPSLIEQVLGAPLSNLVNSYPGSFVICFATLFFWCLGIHGNMIVMPFTTPVTMVVFANNAALVAAGQPAQFEPIMLTMAINLLGGTGNTLSLVLLSLKAESEQLRAFGKAAIIPSVCRISEPAIFGAPIVYNPILMIPFILGGMVSALLYWLVCSTGLVIPMYLMVTGTFPIFINSFIKCLDVKMIIFEVVLIPILGVIWYPFFKVYDKNLLNEEIKNKEIAEQELANA